MLYPQAWPASPGGSAPATAREPSAAGSIPQPDVACDIPRATAGNTSGRGEITSRPGSAGNDFGDFFGKIKEFEDVTPASDRWTDQGGSRLTGSNRKMAGRHFPSPPSSPCRSQPLMDYDVKAPQRQVREVHLGLHAAWRCGDHHGSACCFGP